jgi:hypothetical protein
MFGLYTPIVLLQAFCLYHAYKNNMEQRWYWFILLFPGVGCAIYLYHSFYNRSNITNLSESVKGVINSSYKLEQLEKAFRFSDNITNRINLADGYVAYGRNAEALELYKGALVGFMADDPGVKMKILNAYYLNRDFNEAIEVGQSLESEKTFKYAEQRLAYAWSLHFAGRSVEAEAVFASMDKSYTNYIHRLEFCKFLVATGRVSDMKQKVAEVLDEFEHVKGPERKFHKNMIQGFRALLETQQVKAKG